jgi:hypothetical protein
LFERDFNLIDPENLIEGGKLNDNLVEALMHALFVKHKVKKSYIFSNEICYNVLYKFQHSKVVKRDFKTYNNIIGFLNLNQNHWAVIYADKVSRTFFYIDPFIANESEINMGFKKWVKFMESRPTGDFPKINSWKVGSFKHDKQKDVVNCGLLCVMFLECLIIDKSNNCTFDDEIISNYRKKCFSLLKDHKE